ncbi:MAG: GPW/gp25 family protein [Desulfobacterales bacterium]|nr:GPW/gp25 family protein [Desulfobacterales bacterium]
MRRLIDPKYMAFPFQINTDGAMVSGRKDHIREQIEQVLFTNPGERVFRPHFGGGVRQLIFEPNTTQLSDMVKKRLVSSLTDALFGEVDPRSLDVDVVADNEKLNITISYQLATIGLSESYTVALASEGS